MIELKTILVPVDFSEPSKKALSYGLTLAGQFHANLVLAHIVPESAALMYAFPVSLPEIEKEQLTMARQEIDNLVAAEHSAGLNLRTIVKIGDVEKDLLQIVKDEGIDLVVMGTHGRRRWGRWFIGSLTEHLLRDIPVPALTVSHIEEETRPIGFVSLKRILYATDLSETADVGLKYAIALARGAGARLTIIHVVDDEDRMLWGPALMARFERAKMLQEWRHKLDGFIKRKGATDISMEGVVLEGKAFRKIVDYAEAENMDIIVLNLQSKSFVERAVLGSTAERVVRLARTPVISVPVAGTFPDQRPDDNRL